MADITITATQNGAYEINLTGNTLTTIDVQIPANGLTGIQIMAHSNGAPVYVKLGTTVTVKDPDSHIIPANSWAMIVPELKYSPPGTGTTIAAISSQPATISVIRT